MENNGYCYILDLGTPCWILLNIAKFNVLKYWISINIATYPWGDAFYTCPSLVFVKLEMSLIGISEYYLPENIEIVGASG